MKNIIDNKTIEIYENIELSVNETNNLFIYGKRVNDFKKLDYSSLYSLNIKATQEMMKIIEEQTNELNELNNRLNLLYYLK